MVMPSQLRSARESLKLPIREAAKALELSEEQLDSWESGTSTPTMEQVWKLADFYSRDADYFLTEAPPAPIEISFRSAERKDIRGLSIENRKLVARFDELCRAQFELEEILNETRNITIRKAKSGIEPEDLARQERIRLGIYQRPIRDMRDMLEKQGVRVFELDISDGTFSGLSWWHPTYGPCVLVNYADTVGRRNFTLAHEYCHLLLDDDATACKIEFDYIQAVSEERAANLFAVAFLMPPDVIRAEFQQRGIAPEELTDKRLGNFASRFSVSLEAMGRRLEELGIVHRGLVAERLENWKTRRRFWPRGKRKPKWQKQLGSHFVGQAMRAQSQGYISLTTLSNYLGVDIREAYKAVHEK